MIVINVGKSGLWRMKLNSFTLSTSAPTQGPGVGIIGNYIQGEKMDLKEMYDYIKNLNESVSRLQTHRDKLIAIHCKENNTSFAEFEKRFNKYSRKHK